MTTGDGVYGWCGSVYKVAVAVGLCVCEMRSVEQVWAKNPKPSCHGLVSGCSGAAGGGEGCGGVTAPPPVLN